jgi:hypothetical protein
LPLLHQIAVMEVKRGDLPGDAGRTSTLWLGAKRPT